MTDGTISMFDEEGNESSYNILSTKSDSGCMYMLAETNDSDDIEVFIFKCVEEDDPDEMIFELVEEDHESFELAFSLFKEDFETFGIELEE